MRQEHKDTLLEYIEKTDQELTPELKKIWLKALRSGKYRQTRSSLRTHEGYCCLGVLAEVSGDFASHKYEYSYNYKFFHKDYGQAHDASTTCLPEEYLPSPLQNVLITMNDIHGCSFEEIADFIEEYL